MIELPRVEFEQTPESLGFWPYAGEWLAQEKIDGERALLEWGNLRGRKLNHNLPGDLPEAFRSAVLDGELVGGVFHVFDVVCWGGQEMSRQPLESRLALLDSIAPQFPAWMKPVESSVDLAGFYAEVVARGGEGVVAKKLSAGWGKQWVKVKHTLTHDLVVESLDASKRSAACYQIRNGERLDVGRVFLGRAFESVRVGDVIEVVAMSRHASGKLREARFVRSRPDKPAAACVVTA